MLEIAVICAVLTSTSFWLPKLVDCTTARNCTKSLQLPDHYECTNGAQDSAMVYYEKYTCPDAVQDSGAAGSTYTVYYNDLATLTSTPQERAV